VVSEEPTTVKTFEAYGWRFDIEENCLDDQSNGFQLESSLIRSAAALERLCLVLAISTLSLVSQGVAVLNQGNTPVGRSAWVSRSKLAEKRLAVGHLCPDQRIRAHHARLSSRGHRS
jgi:hypothetical protein